MRQYSVLRVQDYGPFQQAELRVSRLTVIIGPNSTGKSLLAYTYTALSRALNPLNLAALAGAEETRLHEKNANTNIHGKLQPNPQPKAGKNNRTKHRSRSRT